MASRAPKARPAPRPIVKAKPMSSRLLTMNFMQRNASAPGSKSHAEIQKAVEEENAKREAALLATRDRSEASTREDAETRWELSFVRKASQAPVRVVTVGYGELAGGEYGDEEEEEEKEKGTGGRMKFGKYGVDDTPKKPVQEISDDSSSSSDDSDSDSSQNRQTKKIKKKVKKRDDDEKLLKNLQSISNSGPPSTSGPVGGGGKCFQCGKPGHVRAACPELEIQRKHYTDNINRGNPSKRGRFSR
ncbi:hypothetical protein B9Z19DRAFT_1081635 [Tuber borchii]|uniref:CCHC-type domain-containing protein n=1 Tax=Tuber borchii TaxID=42251 RepID=A0A2T6ZVI1_TUBBO|nr:hypothetical protein B9Z19DRAFT_1081635 [Tuber borchii]